MTFGPAVGNVGMYVAREMLAAVPEDQRAGLPAHGRADLRAEVPARGRGGPPAAAAAGRARHRTPSPRYLAQVAPGGRGGLEERRRGRQAAPRPLRGPGPSSWPSATSRSSPTPPRARRRTPRPPSWPRSWPTWSASCARWSPRSSARRSSSRSWPPATGATRSGASTRWSWPPPSRPSSPGCARATARPTWPRCARSPPPTPRPRWRRPTPCSTCSTASASAPRARPSGSPAASRCSIATRRSGAATSAWVSKYALQVLDELKEGLALKSGGPGAQALRHRALRPGRGHPRHQRDARGRRVRGPSTSSSRPTCASSRTTSATSRPTRSPPPTAPGASSSAPTASP